MPYISLDNLTQYNNRLRDYIDGSFDKLDGANWRKTSAAQSVSCWPIPESPLEPEVAFKFSEVPPESGTKGPDNPSTIVGVESVSCNVCESEGVSDTPYSIDLGGTYYGGTVNFATGVMEVTHYKAVFDGTETVNQGGTTNNYWFVNKFFPILKSGGLFVSTHFDYAGGLNNQGFLAFDNRPTGARFGWSYTTSSLWESAQAVQNWLSEQYTAKNPFTVLYELETPEIVPLTPVLVRSLPALSHYVPRQNTIYTPHESVQVGYAKSASKTSQDLANAIVALGGNV